MDQQTTDQEAIYFEELAMMYDRWSQSAPIMQKYSYYSILNEIKKEGDIQGKTFLEVGCGPCPIG